MNLDIQVKVFITVTTARLGVHFCLVVYLLICYMLKNKAQVQNCVCR